MEHTHMIKVMGILNTTPDSFSDGGSFDSLDTAYAQALQMIEEGANIIDIGGESTRPGATKVSLAEELDRVIPVIEKIKANCNITLSIDTSKAEVMSEALRAGVDMINDVRALRERGALQVCAQSEVPICIMHMQGLPNSMQKKPEYTNILKEVSQFFEERIEACFTAGIKRNRLILDPGFGFGKTLEHNLNLLANLNTFNSFGLPILVGLSNKSMIGSLLDNAPIEARLAGSLSAAVIASMKGSAIIRVHHVKETVDAIKVVEGIKRYE